MAAGRIKKGRGWGREGGVLPKAQGGIRKRVMRDGDSSRYGGPPAIALGGQVPRDGQAYLQAEDSRCSLHRSAALLMEVTGPWRRAGCPLLEPVSIDAEGWGWGWEWGTVSQVARAWRWGAERMEC